MAIYINCDETFALCLSFSGIHIQRSDKSKGGPNEPPPMMAKISPAHSTTSKGRLNLHALRLQGGNKAYWALMIIGDAFMEKSKDKIL